MFTWLLVVCFFFQAEDGIRDLVRSRGLGDVYKRQIDGSVVAGQFGIFINQRLDLERQFVEKVAGAAGVCLLYTSDAADERSSVDLGGRRIIKKKKIYIRTILIDHEQSQQT